ncbi:unnamed protein product [Plutella xylostella]|uniref:(diamondback moth) hypothetical protein n=1 Tax=Plutella xylostella TaxID=51655 RepID=A0A8S4FAM5_PLUXY|nr:unnamed protein product [Plutella xylostella]
MWYVNRRGGDVVVTSERRLVSSVSAGRHDIILRDVKDSSYADGYSPAERVAQRYVIAIKEGKGRAP